MQFLFASCKLMSRPEGIRDSLKITEHANLRERWFQEALVGQSWTKPPALVPEDWPQKDEKSCN